MKRIFAFLVAAIAATGLAFAQKAETPKSGAMAPAKTEAKKAEAKTEAPKGDPMDINSASESELATLKGIGDVRAKAIVKHRPYKGKDDLVRKKIIPQKVYDEIKDQIIAKQDTAAAMKKEEPKKADTKKK